MGAADPSCPAGEDTPERDAQSRRPCPDLFKRHNLAETLSYAAAALLNLMYDAMPAEYVSVIITELGAIPCTSVPVILREYQQQPNM